MAKVWIIMRFAVALMLILEVVAVADHTIGASSGGWDLSTNLSTWASSQIFAVGDNLVFEFDSSHDVLEVSKENYDSCGTRNPLSTTTTSPATFALAVSGSRYFVCGIGAHCSQGMKIQVDVVAATTTPAPPQATNTSSQTRPRRRRQPSRVTGETVDPPSSAMSLNMTTGTILRFGFLVTMILGLV